MKKDCNCLPHGTSPFWGDGFSRRRFLQVAGTGIVASYFADVASASLIESASAVAPPLQNTAKNCIFVFLSGGPSQTDMWDLKEGAWTPASFTPTSFGDVRWPNGLLPKMGAHLNKLGIIRSGLAWAAVHPLAQKWAQISRNPTGATGGIAPHIGAVVSLESQLNRKPTDVLPGFIALNGTMAGAGYFPASYAPFAVQPSQTGLSSLTHPDGAARLNTRWNLIGALDPVRDSGELGRDAADMASYYDQAKVLIDTPGINNIFSFSTADRTRYGATTLGDSMLVARNIVAANKGARFVHVTDGGWDHHSNIYAAAGGSLIVKGKQLDDAIGALLTDLSTTNGAAAGKTLLDETLVVILGEFGRTVGPITNGAGRDHYLRMSVVMAGGGVRGGRVIGVTNETGSAVKEYGWSGNRDVRPEDVTSTIYSAMGIDYTLVRHDDPLNRGFEFVPFAKDGVYKPVSELC